MTQYRPTPPPDLPEYPRQHSLGKSARVREKRRTWLTLADQIESALRSAENEFARAFERADANQTVRDRIAKTAAAEKAKNRRNQ